MEIHRLVMAAELQWREKAGIYLSIYLSQKCPYVAQNNNLHVEAEDTIIRLDFYFIFRVFFLSLFCSDHSRVYHMLLWDTIRLSV